jgi:cytochrome b6
VTGERAREAALDWLGERFPVRKLLEVASKKEVPLGHHSMVWYFLGGMTLFFFTVQIVSGVLLLMYYQPGEDTSYESIVFITQKVPFGWLVRSVHCWSAHLMVLSLVLHMFSAMLLKAYRRPRELTWLTGILLFAITLTFGFSGYLLPWNELAFFATAVGTDSVKAVPVIGDWLLQVMRGGPDVTINTLYRFFALHVVILPLAVGVVMGVHLLFIQVQGLALPVGESKAPRSMKFFPSFAARDVLLWLVGLILLSVLALFLPYGPGVPGIDWELGLKADPLAPAYPGIKPEWYFLWVYQLLKEFPPHVLGMEGPQAALLLVTLVLGIWALLPFLDRRSRRELPSPGFTDFAIGGMIFTGWLTLKAWDIGGGAGPDGLPDPQAVAWTTAWIMLALAGGATLVRWLVFDHRWFAWTAAQVVHLVLHGLVGLSYLLGGVIALALGVVLVLIVMRRESAPPTADAAAS